MFETGSVGLVETQLFFFYDLFGQSILGSSISVRYKTIYFFCTKQNRNSVIILGIGTDRP